MSRHLVSQRCECSQPNPERNPRGCKRCREIDAPHKPRKVTPVSTGRYCYRGHEKTGVDGRGVAYCLPCHRINEKARQERRRLADDAVYRRTCLWCTATFEHRRFGRPRNYCPPPARCLENAALERRRVARAS